MSSKYETFAECVQKKDGFIIQHKETKWQYTDVFPTEEEAWKDLDRIACKLGQGLATLLEVCPVVTIELQEGGKFIVPAKPKRGRPIASPPSARVRRR